MKKTLGIIAGVAMVMAVAVPALAKGYQWSPKQTSTKLTVDNKDTTVISNVTSTATTGGSEQTITAIGGEVEKASQTSYSGDAASLAQSEVNVNGTVYDVNCNCFKNVSEISTKNDDTFAISTVSSTAKTGGSEQEITAFGYKTNVEKVSQYSVSGNAASSALSLTKVNWTKIK